MRAACSVFVAMTACRFAPAPVRAPDAGAGRIVDDTAADFAAGSASELDVDPLGLLVPAAYATGGLHARAYATQVVDQTMTLDEVEAALAMLTPTGEAYGVMPADWATDRPHGLWLTSSDGFTLAFDGELYLPADPVTIQLSADDNGLFEIDLGAIRPVVRAHYTDAAPDAITVTPPHAGWYAVRGAMSDSFGGARFVVSLGRGTTPTAAGADVLRAPVSAAQGLIVSGAANRVLAPLVDGTSVETSLDQPWGTAQPGYDLAVGNAGFSLRFAGQLRIDQPGMYAFGLDTGSDADDHARVIVDGNPVASTWPGQVVAPAPQPLAPGWHDVIVDYSDTSGNAQLTATLAPPGGAPAPLSGAQLRPVRAGGLLATATASTIGWNATATVPFTPTSAGSGATVDFADAYFQVTPRAHTQVALAEAAGSDALAAAGALPATPAWDGAFDAFPGRAALAGAPVDAAWQLAFDDASGDGGGSIASPALALTYHGGPGGPYATQMTYVSAPHPTPGATSIDAAHVTGDLHGATLAVDVRTGDASSIAAAPWVPVQDGVPPAAAPGALVEYRLTLTGDGWQAPAIDRVEVDYTEGP